MRKLRSLVLIAVAVVAPLGLSGCFPLSMGIFTPIPVMPWVTENMEDKYCNINDNRTPLMPPIREGFPPPICEDPPDEAQVQRFMPHVIRGVPYFYEEFRDDIQIVTERLVDKIDPPRFYPLIGPAQLHHCHWKCTIYYTETIESSYPFPFRCRKPRVQVVYIDKDHLHSLPCGPQDAQRQFSRDLSGY
jgi:hypothetical protein